MCLFGCFCLCVFSAVFARVCSSACVFVHISVCCLFVRLVVSFMFMLFDVWLLLFFLSSLRFVQVLTFCSFIFLVFFLCLSCMFVFFFSYVCCFFCILF